MRFWNKWPYWLRGGIIGGVVALLSVLLYYSCSVVVSGYTAFWCGIFISFGPVYAVFWLLNIAGLGFLLHDTIWGHVFSYSDTRLFIISIIVWFFLGALVGTLVGCIKPKKESVQ